MLGGTETMNVEVFLNPRPETYFYDYQFDLFGSAVRVLLQTRTTSSLVHASMQDPEATTSCALNRKPPQLSPALYLEVHG